MNSDDQASYDPHALGPPREVSEDAAAKKMSSENDNMLNEISPLGGYGHGDYIAHCHWCRRQFIGDKRATQCLPCAISRAQEAAHAAGKAEGAAEEQRVSRFILNCWMNDDNEEGPDYFPYWAAAKCFESDEQITEHEGDCINEPQMCRLCYQEKLENVRAMANAAIRARTEGGEGDG